MRARTKGKPLQEPCFVCGEARWTEEAHFPTRKRDGAAATKTVQLCPTHHRLLDSGRLSRHDFVQIMTRMKDSDQKWTSVEDFVGWAHENGYPYSLEDLRNKFWDNED